MNNKIWMVVSLAIGLLLVVACPSSPELGEPLDFGVILADSERWDRDLEAMTAWAEDQGNVTIISHQSNDTEDQNSAFQSMLAQQVDAFIVAAHEGYSDVSRSWVNQANQAGIPFICFDRPITDVAGIDFYVSYNNSDIGRLQGQYILDHTQVGETVLVLKGSEADPNAEVFLQGALSVLQSEFDSSQRILYAGEVIPVGDWNPANAYQVISDIPSEDIPGIDAILCPNDGLYLDYGSDTGKGIYAALSTEHELSDTQIAGEFVITGQDAQINALKQILADPQLLDMTILKDTRKLAAPALESARALAQGGSPVSNSTYNNGTQDIPANLVSAQVIESLEDVQVYIIDTGFLTEAELGIE
jgi:putative multiple sugar transport system substrate-binding protein